MKFFIARWELFPCSYFQHWSCHDHSNTNLLSLYSCAIDWWLWNGSRSNEWELLYSKGQGRENSHQVDSSRGIYTLKLYMCVGFQPLMINIIMEGAVAIPLYLSANLSCRYIYTPASPPASIFYWCSLWSYPTELAYDHPSICRPSFIRSSRLTVMCGAMAWCCLKSGQSGRSHSQS